MGLGHGGLLVYISVLGMGMDIGLDLMSVFEDNTHLHELSHPL